MKKHFANHLKQVEELNITAFMNLMVILVPFLLITAVFTEITIVELNIPVLDASQDKPAALKLQLELVLRENSFDVQDGNIGLIKRFDRTKGETNWQLFSNFLLEIKSRFPNEKSITLLVEPAVDYKTLIRVMDYVRTADVAKGLSVESYELFPEISIGDASPVVQ